MTVPASQTSGDVEKLREVAERALEAYRTSCLQWTEEVTRAHYAFGATFNPPAVLRLLAELSEARGEYLEERSARMAANNREFAASEALALARKGLERIANPRDYDWDAADKYSPRDYGEGRVDASRQLADIAHETLLALSGGKKDE